MKQAITSLVVIALGIATAVVLVRMKPQAQEKGVAEALVSVRTEAAREAKAVMLEGTGRVEPVNRLQLTSEVRAKVIWVNEEFIPGRILKKGTVLVRLDPTDYNAMVAQREAEVARARLNLLMEKAQAQVARRDFERSPLKVKSKEARALALHEPQVTLAQATLKAALQGLSQAKSTLKKTVIRIPFDGLVLSRDVSLGQLAVPGARLGVVAETTHFWVKADIPVDRAGYLEVGEKVTITSEMGSGKWEGTLVDIEGEVEEGGALVKALVDVKDPLRGKDPLRLGSFVKVKFPAKGISGVWVPRAALQEPGKVWIVKEDKIWPKRIKVLLREGEYALVQGDVKPGDRVVVSRLEEAVEGMRVREFK